MLSPALIHGNLKANNVFVDDEGNPRIGDFRLAPVSREIFGLAPRSRLMSSLRWASPELMTNRTPTKATDVWAFGCTLIEVSLQCVSFTIVG